MIKAILTPIARKLTLLNGPANAAGRPRVALAGLVARAREAWLHDLLARRESSAAWAEARVVSDEAIYASRRPRHR
jgi:hypothetical protein